MTDLRSLLIGRWTLSRTVTGAHVMQGVAAWVPGEDGVLHYREEGLSLLGGAGRPLKFSRRYLYAAEAQRLRIFFDEAPPRLFQAVALRADAGGWRGTGLHLCASDSYRSTYRFERDGRLHVRHEVSGPRKAYAIATDYARLPASGEGRDAETLVGTMPC